MSTSRCTLLFTVLSFSLFAQSNSTSWAGMHLTFPVNDNSAFIDFGGDLFSISYRIKHTEFAHFGASFRKNRDTGWFQEFSIVDVEVREEEETDITFHFPDVEASHFTQRSFRLRINTRYEYGKLLVNASSNKVLPALSVGIDPYVQFFNVLPRNVNLHGNTLSIGGRMSIIPRLLFKLGDNLQLDINAPVPFYEFFVQKDEVLTPASPLIETNNETTFKWGSYFEIDEIPLRLGLLYRLH